ncbi:DUF2846 domain-containing protein [Chitinimonas sp.]|uniref:DUF2846 domain-containing protein n=1 Tax=Chitinimonas sp. TaxID=1934313 RepID=UPI002F9391FE
MIKIIVASTLALVYLSGCASSRASGVPYAEYKGYPLEANPTRSRLVIYRPSAGMMTAARDTRLKVNELPVGSCQPGGFIVSSHVPGTQVLAADLADSPGACKVTLETEAGKEYFFEVRPRSEAITSGLMLGVLGQALESSGKVCGGAFSIEQVDAQTAANALSQLRFSE